MLKQAEAKVETFDDLVNLLERAIVEDPGISLREGGIIKSGYNEELDEYRRISHDSKAMLQEIEEREKEQTGIKALKIGYNKVFGYYIEVRHSGADRVPDRYIRKQTLANAERYITEELKEFETKILGAQEKIVNIEYNLFTEVRETIKAHLTEIQQTAHEIALVDVLASLAEAASTYNYVRPQMRTDGVIDIKDGPPSARGAHPDARSFRAERCASRSSGLRDHADHGPEHGGQVDVHAPGGTFDAHGADWQLHPRARGLHLAGRPHLHTHRRER